MWTLLDKIAAVPPTEGIFVCFLLSLLMGALLSGPISRKIEREEEKAGIKRFRG